MLTKKQFKNMLYEWKELIKENSEERTKNFSDIIQMHKPSKTLYHITTYSPDYFKNGLQLKNASSLSVKETSTSQGTGIYFFCNPSVLKSAFDKNNADYLLVVEEDYKNNSEFLPDLEICAGYFVDWYVNNINRLSKNGFKSQIIRKHFVKGGPHPILSSGAPHTALVPQKGKMHILSQYKTYESFASESGETVYQVLQEIKDFSQRDYEDAINYIMSNDLDAVKYVGSQTINVKKIYKLDKNLKTLSNISNI